MIIIICASLAMMVEINRMIQFIFVYMIKTIKFKSLCFILK
jgi:hypothetical protein